MNEEIQSYKPASGADLAMRISREGENISEEIAYKLYDMYFGEATARNEQPDEFTPNFAYVLENGIVFRLFDPGEEAGQKVIEVMADPEHPYDPEMILGNLSEVLREAGVENARALEKLEAVMNAPRRGGRAG
jgi:hypothetical protein